MTGPAPLRLVARPHPFRQERVDLSVPHGLTLEEMLRLAQPDPVLRRHAVAYIDDWLVAPELWPRVRPRPGRLVTICAVPAGGGGGKNVLRAVLTIAVLAFAVALPGMLPASWGIVQGSFAAGLISAGAGVVGSLLINALVPPPMPKLGRLGESGESPTYFLQGARNLPRPFAPVPLVLGQHRVVPPLGARTVTEPLGELNLLRMLVVWGHGPLEIADLRIADTPIAEFEISELVTRPGADDDPPLSIYTQQIDQEDLQVELTEQSGWHQRTTSPGADEISIDLTLPRGGVRFDDRGRRQPVTVVLELRFRQVGEETWLAPSPSASTMPDDWVSVDSGHTTITLTHQRPTSIRHGLRWPTPERSQYEVEVRRTTEDAADDDDRVFDAVWWTALRRITDEPPVVMPGVATTELVIRATGQLAGVLDELNAVCTPIVPDWDPGTSSWVQRPSRNPASLFRWILQGPGNARPLPDHRLDLVRLAAWHEYCETHGLAYDLVVDFDISVYELLFDVASAGHAVPTMVDGRWGVAIDRPQTVPIQHFTPRNSWDFRGEKAFSEIPHGFRVRFVNREKGYRADERLVFDDGYDPTTATHIEAAEAPGITDPDLVWRHWRRHIAAARLRPERYSWSADVEHIVCRKGDLVAVAHDVPLWGLGWGRVKAIQEEDDEVLAVTLDDRVTMQAETAYVVRFRLGTGERVTHAVVTAPGTTGSLTFATPVPSAEAPQPGDLYMFGELDREVALLVVTSIERGPDLSARITAVDAAPGIHEADTGLIPPFDSLISGLPPIPAPHVVSIVSDRSATEDAGGTAVLARLVVTVLPFPIEDLRALLEVQVHLGDTHESWFTPEIVARPTPSSVIVGGVAQGEAWAFRLRWRPEGRLPGPWSDHYQADIDGVPPPAALTGVIVESGAEQGHVRRDGTLWRRMRVSWDQHPDQLVLERGRIEVQYRKATGQPGPALLINSNDHLAVNHGGVLLI